MNQLHYPSIELCKKLHEIGFPETNYSWDGEGESGNYRYMICESSYGMFPCPNVMEMLDVMPHKIPIEGLEHLIQYDNATTYYFLSISHGTVQYANQMRRVQLVYFNVERNDERSIPNALAEMILWLVENKHLSFNK